MKLVNKKRNQIVIEVTPEMKQRLRELNESVIRDSKKAPAIAMQSNAMQNASMMAAIELGK